MQAAEGPVAGRTGEFVELRRQLDAGDADIVLVNKRLDEAQGMYSLRWSTHIKRSIMLVSIICCDCRWSCRRGDPSGRTCPGQGTSQEE